MTHKSPLPEDQGPTFDPTVHWCPRHLEPFRATWGISSGWICATLGLFDEAIRRREILEALGWKPPAEDGGEPERFANVRMLDRVLREYAPLCCLLGDEVTERWTRLGLGPIEEFKAAHDALQATIGPVD